MNEGEFTGERFVPGHGGAQMAYEHAHRYAFALRWARGRKVLDVATGNGYGAAMLARSATAVLALDIDVPSLSAAARTWAAGNVCFAAGDARRLPLRDRTIELAAAFEVLEHTADHEELVGEIARVLTEQGLALISTPDRAIYSDERAYSNPYHMRELYRDEFIALLARHFAHVCLFRQQVRSGSLIDAGENAPEACDLITAPLPGPSRPETRPMYLIAACSHAPLPDPPPSVYIDLSDLLSEEWRRSIRAAGEELRRLNLEIERLGAWGQDLERIGREKDSKIRAVLDEIEARDRTVTSLQAELLAETARRDEEIRRLGGEFEERSRWAQVLETEIAGRDQYIRQANAALDAAAARLARIRHAPVYRVLRRLRLLPD